ncbi:Gfo/Idh/MocA family oxidoreductase [Rubripirellula sp.]|jgi:predicted dehydrogenase|nr:Gfo/Idh/MocA family oxidoreductase [Planctomycetaceae bacterium]MDA9857113.1 Gfo/Idh/MocA family oxidoreductase [Rubripirellula sp.]MDF1843387.1 Gfo/Idh/MocA family oxidoreductase [Rubripirellula sp.]
MTRRTTRRKFVGQSAALTAGVGYWAGTSPNLLAQQSALQAPAAACVGVGGKGSSDTSHIAEHGVAIAGLCDVDGGTLTKKGREFPDAKQFQDYREMLDALGDKVDIVTVSTPDHSHAAAAVRAMRLKKHVYCQKPLTWSIAEARMMRETAAEMGVVTQMGNQGTSEDGLREAVEVIQSGAIGDVKAIHIWSNRPVWPQGIGRPKGADPVPESLNWDAWIGPAPMRPYKENVYHSFKWRGWVDFGTGALGDMACHTTNMPVMALKLWDPIAVTAVRNPGFFENETFPASSSLMFEFPESEGLAARQFYWYDGGNLPPDDVISQLPESFQKRVAQQRDGGRKTSGAVIIGTKGILFSPDDYGAKYFLLPEEKFTDYQPPEQRLPRIPFKGGGDQRQKWEFVATVKGEYEPGTMSNFGYAGRLTETILVGNLALRAGEGQRIEWDPVNLKSTNRPEVNQYVAREYRSGWEI